MELNITRQNVSSCEIAFSQNVEQGVDFTVNIPDYCGAVQRVLKYGITPRISSKTVNGQTLCVEGNACFTIIYLDEDGQVSSYEYTAAFTKNIELGFSSDIMRICVTPKCGYINAKAVTPSRIDVHSVIELSVCVYRKKTAEIICDIDSSDIFMSRGEAPATLPVNSAEKNMIIEEELSLEPNFPAVGCIIRYDSSAVILGAKIVNDKVIAKGELHLEILYCSDDRSTRQKYCTTVPFSQIIDVDGITEECECDVTAEIAAIELKPRSAYDGEVRSFMLNAKLCIDVRALCNNDVAVIYDAYSKKYNTSVTNSDTTFEKIINNISELFVCKKNIEFSDGDIHNIIDLWCVSSLGGYRTEQNNVILSGTVIVCLIAENSDGIINYFERPIDFEYRFDAGKLPENLRLEPSVSAVNSAYSLLGENSLEVKVELSISACIYEIRKINILTSIEITEKENSKACNECAMVIYYAEKGERIWNIAKRFNASPDEIMEVNSVGEEIADCMPLLISC